MRCRSSAANRGRSIPIFLLSLKSQWYLDQHRWLSGRRSPTIVPESEGWKKLLPPLSAWAIRLPSEHGELAASRVRAHAPSTFWLPMRLKIRLVLTIISLRCFCTRSVVLWARGELQCVRLVRLDTVMAGRSFESSYALHFGVPYTMNQYPWSKAWSQI